jgi:hypothetical protein
MNAKILLIALLAAGMNLGLANDAAAKAKQNKDRKEQTNNGRGLKKGHNKEYYGIGNGKDKNNVYDRNDPGQQKRISQDQQIARQREIERERQIARQRQINREQQVVRQRQIQRNRQMEATRDVSRQRQIDRDRQMGEQRAYERQQTIERQRQAQMEQEQASGGGILQEGLGAILNGSLGNIF